MDYIRSFIEYWAHGSYPTPMKNIHCLLSKLLFFYWYNDKSSTSGGISQLVFKYSHFYEVNWGQKITADKVHFQLYEYISARLQWIQILCGVAFMQISYEPLVRSMRGLQHRVQNWKIDSAKFYMNMKSGYRDICMKVTPQSIWIHCKFRALKITFGSVCLSVGITGSRKTAHTG